MNTKENKTRIVRFHETGEAEVLKIEEVPLEEPKANEVRIKVEAIGLNRAEVAFRAGNYLEQPKFPSKIGYEASGVVDAIGSEVQSVKVGDKVSTIPSFSMNDYGTYGETAILPEHAVTTYPAQLSAVEATSIWMPFTTAYGGLIENGKLKKDDFVLITAASSSVGLAAIQITKSKGGIAIATTRKEEKEQYLLDAGADHVIVTDDEDLVERTQEITDGNGIDISFDPIGAEMVASLTKAAGEESKIIQYGSLTTKNVDYPLFPILSKRLTIKGYILLDITTDKEKRKKAKDFVVKGIEEGSLTPTIDKTFAFEKIVDAHKYMESNQQKGKIVVVVN